jgi:GT2 family glycosyltransferase
MVSVVYSTRKPNKEFQEYIKKTIGLKDFEIYEIVNNGQKSLTQCYNEGLDNTKNNIVVFCHDDLLLKEGWGKKIIKHFQNTDYGILGMAGTTDMAETGRWWEDQSKMVGIVSHSHQGKTWENRYSENFGDDIIETVILDGLFFVAHKDRIKKRFDESFKGFHLYDVDFTFNNHLNGVKVGVMFDIKITHKSIGMTNEEWEKNREQFVQKYKDNLPYKIKPEVRFIGTPFSKKLKENPKIAIIIPTKGNVHLLKQCINSIYDQDGYTMFKIYIADTGSTEEEKTEIKNFISKMTECKLIEYDFYNFAVINNDVVENHIDKDTELLLFCNNDIKLLNDAITRMVVVYLKNKKTVGTIGARLHFGDNTVQHSGIRVFLNQEPNGMYRIILTHKGFKSYYSFYGDNRKIFGNTGAFLMINKELFLKIGGFNTNYRECFEDVELNIQCLNHNKENIFCGDAVCYHYESQTRNKDEKKARREYEDYSRLLIPFVVNNKKTYHYFDNIDAKNLDHIIKISDELKQFLR